MGKLRQAGVMKILPVGGGISAASLGYDRFGQLGPEDERTPYLTRCPLPFLPVVQETVAGGKAPWSRSPATGREPQSGSEPIAHLFIQVILIQPGSLFPETEGREEKNRRVRGKSAFSFMSGLGRYGFASKSTKEREECLRCKS